ncbi:MAG: 6-bladed beta-propeller [Candidatus Krumholzibacteria bacterium]|nr:6-bladed beta-propeller [Candidatus Krumholzibacteria bacterium]
MFSLPSVSQAADPVITNSDAPADGILKVQLEELWRIGGEEDEENLLGVIDRVLVDDDGNVYLLDIQLVEVQVFDADGEYVRSLGKQGDGPGELRNVRGVLFLPDGTVGMVQGFPGRIVKVDLAGLPTGELKPGGNDPSAGGFFALRSAASSGGRLVLGGAKITRGDNSRTATNFIAAFDQDGAENVRYLESVNVRDFGKMEFSEKGDFFPGQGGWALADDGRLYVAPARNEYRIEVHGPDGGLERTITRKYESWRRTPVETDRAREMMMPFRRRNRNAIKLVMEPTERDILDIRLDPRGQLWVLPSRGVREQDEGIHSTWDVFDSSGAFVRQMAIACEGDGQKDALFFPGGGLVVLVREHADAVYAFRGRGADNPETEEEDAEVRPLEVICYRISP